MLMRMPKKNCLINNKNNYTKLFSYAYENAKHTKLFSYLQYKTTSLIHEDNMNKEDLWITKH